ncbi:hypothetical protein BS50DRAFT_491387, partial [Corynespora cassiicola Philippines]
NCEIALQKKKYPIFKPIYSLIEKKLVLLQVYFNKNFKKEFIRELTLKAEYLIIFIFKKDGSLQLYINFRKLNNIIIKNRYLLPNI